MLALTHPYPRRGIFRIGCAAGGISQTIGFMGAAFCIEGAFFLGPGPPHTFRALVKKLKIGGWDCIPTDIGPKFHGAGKALLRRSLILARRVCSMLKLCLDTIPTSCITGSLVERSFDCPIVSPVPPCVNSVLLVRFKVPAALNKGPTWAMLTRIPEMPPRELKRMEIFQ